MKEHTKKTISLEEAKAQFEELLEELLDGEAIIITREGKTSIQISAESKSNSDRVLPGKHAGQIKVSDDFDEWSDDIARQLDMDV